MKKILFTLSFIAFCCATKAQEINWISFNEAIELQKKSPKKIMIDAYTNWCGPCKLLDKKTFHNKDVVAFVNQHFYAVKFNGEGKETVTFKGTTFGNPKYDPARANTRNSAHEFTNAIGVNAYPAIIFFNEKGELLFPLRGYQNPQQLEFYLRIFQEDKYLELTTSEQVQAYHKAFKPRFKD